MLEVENKPSTYSSSVGACIHPVETVNRKAPAIKKYLLIQKEAFSCNFLFIFKFLIESIHLSQMLSYDDWRGCNTVSCTGRTIITENPDICKWGWTGYLALRKAGH